MSSPYYPRSITETIAGILAKTMQPEGIAAILNATVMADDDDRLSDSEVDYAECLHETLCKLCPEAIDIAVRGNVARRLTK